VAVAAGDLTAHPAGLAGAGVGLVLAGALAALVVMTETTLGNSVGWFIWLVLYPLSPLLGYDLATGGQGDGPLLRVGGYSVALATAHLAVAVGVALGAGADLDGRSPLPTVLLIASIVVVPPARGAATRVARGLRGGGWALIGAAAFTLVVAWGFWMVAFTQWVARVDS